ncbi:MAG: hypothetical protein R3264_03570 [Anaerolineae bacterium]|nr:hypothetical protein [Anaerolineae bacterium]
MDTIQLNLELHEINRILEALGDQPYKEVFELIAKIQGQAQAQLAEASQPEKEISRTEESNE